MVRLKAPSLKQNTDEYDGTNKTLHHTKTRLFSTNMLKESKSQMGHCISNCGPSASQHLQECCEIDALHFSVVGSSYKLLEKIKKIHCSTSSSSDRMPLHSDMQMDQSLKDKDVNIQQNAEKDTQSAKRQRELLLTDISQNVKRLETLIKTIPTPVHQPPPRPKKIVENVPNPVSPTNHVEPVAATIVPDPAIPDSSEPLTNVPHSQRPQNDEKPKNNTSSLDEFVESAWRKMKSLEGLQGCIKNVSDSSDIGVKKIRVNVKKKIGEACNQIANTPSSIQLVVGKICQVLTDAKNAGELYFHYSLDLVASKFAAQARIVTEIRSCFPVANVIKMCCAHTPELTDIFLAYMYKNCPYTIPFEPQKKAEQSIEDYMVSIGMEYDDNSKNFESREKYIQRMTMIVALMSAVMQTTLYSGQPQPTGLDLSDCWSWLARLINSDTHALTAPVVLAILETSGFQLLNRYKQQMNKLLIVIQNDVVPNLNRDVKSGAAASLARLNTFLAQNEIRIEPEGRQPKETTVTEEDEESSANDDSRSFRPDSYNSGRGRGRGRGGRGFR
ncbi:Aste57867_18890 [Aphanomyces stellatus]|uniref:mRNA export factor GLE1 n=1 Tax=Aphanomyces stellatus TaxID=120398 RepID=A0A485LC39_9STRA|nr:hypothetical protein As57867_018826 [Aphanomyces stellatus]VFT95623.1 Aste57867_18890 [Aphanomyces stellatus]